LKPSLLWQSNGLDFRQPDFFRPRLLAFHSDTFMEDFLVAASAPRPDAFQATLATPQQGQPLKLFQPMHGYFYLICASLCCRLPSFPDRDVRTAEGENTFFVLRKLVNGAEYAWVSAGPQKGWQALNGKTKQVLLGEERHPLLTTTAANGRSLLFGYVPVASRETYNVPPSELVTDHTTPDPRVADLQARFAEPLTRPDPSTASSIIEKTADNVALTLSVYLLLNLWEFLFEHVQDVATILRGDQGAALGSDNTQAKASLLTLLQTHALDGTQLPTPTPQGTLTLAQALGAVATHQNALNQPGGGDPTQLGFSNAYNLKMHRPPVAFLTQLTQSVQNTLSATPPPVELPKLEPQADTLYVIRCVYERPQCDPPVQVVSQASEHFQLAPFFDPEAPARPVRIPLPADVSIAGLRKLKKNVAFMMSEAMHKKSMSIAGKEKDLITGEPALTEPDGDFAFICSFSIQIIFIVAFFLLIMFVVILNFVFWWLAFFKICLPVPKRLLPGGG
jgi:hypothetical protein